MKSFFENLFSFHGRLSRLGYLKYEIVLGIIFLILVILAVPVFSDEQDKWRGLGISYLFGVGVVSLVSHASLIVRRLHDMGRSSLHLVWIAALYPLGQLVLAFAGKSFDLLALGFQYFFQTQVNPNTLAEWLAVTLPSLLVTLWLLLMPGKPE